LIIIFLISIRFRIDLNWTSYSFIIFTFFVIFTFFLNVICLIYSLTLIYAVLKPITYCAMLWRLAFINWVIPRYFFCPGVLRVGVILNIIIWVNWPELLSKL
jgi:hypothetical protein